MDQEMGGNVTTVIENSGRTRSSPINSPSIPATALDSSVKALERDSTNGYPHGRDNALVLALKDSRRPSAVLL